MGTRALVIGLDGADGVIRRLQNDGLLPNLSRLIREGAHGPLDSTTPPLTLPSWSSADGVSPHSDSKRGDWRLEIYQFDSPCSSHYT